MTHNNKDLTPSEPTHQSSASKHSIEIQSNFGMLTTLFHFARKAGYIKPDDIILPTTQEEN
jgi:hypothetical protein